ESLLQSLLSVGAERDKLAFMATLSEEADFTVTFNTRMAARGRQATGIALTRVLRTKGRVVDALADSIGMLLRRARTEDRELIERLTAARSELATVVLRGGGLKGAEYKAEIGRLAAQALRLEEEVSQRSAEIRVQSQPVTVAGVQRVIPKGASLVEFILYRPFNPRPKSRAEAFGEARYAAYLLRRDKPPALVE